ncbi:MAG: hypothetical protein M1169_04105 [Firmicutes bacterium]|nr:hypothetical protein [Bacillota bacterium]
MNIKKMYEEILIRLKEIESFPSPQKAKEIFIENGKLLVEIEKEIPLLTPQEAYDLIPFVQKILNAEEKLKDNLKKKMSEISQKRDHLGNAKVVLKKLKEAYQTPVNPTILNRKT